MSSFSSNEKFNAFIKKYLNSEYAVNPYSKEWLIKRKSVDVSNDYEIDLNIYNDLDQKYGDEYRNQLIIVYVDRSSKDLINDLSKAHCSLKEIFNGNNHWPDFLLINLVMDRIYCIGLGRKNRIFQYALEDYSNNNQENIYLFDIAKTRIDGQSYAKEFIKLDHENYIYNLVNSLSDLGKARFELDGLPNLQEEPQEIEDGLFQIEDLEDPVTKEELDEFIETRDIYEEMLWDAEKSIKFFFPYIDVYDLITGDY